MYYIKATRSVFVADEIIDAEKILQGTYIHTLHTYSHDCSKTCMIICTKKYQLHTLQHTLEKDKVKMKNSHISLEKPALK